MKADLKRIMGLYGFGVLLCAVSVVLTLIWRQEGIAVPGMVRSVVGGLPWVAVAGMLVAWRARGLPRRYPLAFVFGIGTPFLMLYIWSWF